MPGTDPSGPAPRWAWHPSSGRPPPVPAPPRFGLPVSPASRPHSPLQPGAHPRRLPSQLRPPLARWLRLTDCESSAKSRAGSRNQFTLGDGPRRYGMLGDGPRRCGMLGDGPRRYGMLKT
ncbi:hypothetical protein GCM10009645_29210 [Mycolicibacterium poriferae]|uniref:Uncharacterized protein n=1 Tax=Mycolicibacterium poriferae TaxID=39694 RepID=A0A6N4VI10_9MYCO|nr:hypothetical protein MPOR_52870 [Mycolicibacterium poriferae]